MTCGNHQGRDGLEMDTLSSVHIGFHQACLDKTTRMYYPMELLVIPKLLAEVRRTVNLGIYTCSPRYIRTLGHMPLGKRNPPRGGGSSSIVDNRIIRWNDWLAKRLKHYSVMIPEKLWSSNHSTSVKVAMGGMKLGLNESALWRCYEFGEITPQPSQHYSQVLISSFA